LISFIFNDIFPEINLTACFTKSSETQILFEISGVSEDLVKQAVKLISGKISLKIKLIK
jgi:ribosomal protein L16/L10AE